ncbi:uncharacterized protein B0H18DRAFT_574713 [Fomitopsis serialis]|uniref:uncharacterized protein n=1 Tax=Fomitopsis serialis TaxID=139415 RepID=UPI002007C5AB|nr:uncharacterized protein B0H18DRAFT_574713 [Neoantrodia serialis]KAH9921037.1 hypothetical protein B0H18DRAFT_574713 [Neoantrodia serialis]
MPSRISWHLSSRCRVITASAPRGKCEMLPTVNMLGVGVLPWSPLARGILTRPLSAQSKRGKHDGWSGPYKTFSGTAEIIKRYLCQSAIARASDRPIAVCRVKELAEQNCASMALTWSLSKDGQCLPP